MKKHYISPYNPAATELIEALRYDRDIRPDILTKIDSVLEGIEITDKLLLQKDSVINQQSTELQSTKQTLLKKELSLVQKEQEIQLKTVDAQNPTFGLESIKAEFIACLHKLYPDAYPAKFEDWSDKLPMRKHVTLNNVKVMEKNIKIYKELIKEQEYSEVQKEFISSLHKLYPDSYPASFSQWGDNLPMKKHVIENNVKIMVINTKIYKEDFIIKEFVNALHKLYPSSYPVKFEEWDNKLPMHKVVVNRDFKTMEVNTSLYKKLIEEKQDKEIKELKLLVQQQEIEKQELLAQKEAELHDKSFAKNEIIEDLAETIVLKDGRINDLKLLNEELSHIPVGIQIGGVEEASQTSGVALIGDDVDIVLFH